MDQEQYPNSLKKIKTETTEAISLCLDSVMSTCELELESSANWNAIRSRILKLFGDRGLQGRVNQILRKAHSEYPDSGNKATE